MKNLLFLTLLLTMLFLGTVSAEAANQYVRAGASGSANGTDWTNAYTTLPAALTRGDTYYIADGTYPGRVFNTATNGTTLITIKKATVADHGTSTGWSDTFGDGTAIFTSTLEFRSDFWTFDGQTGGGPSNWYGPFGFKVQLSSVTPGFAVGQVNGFTCASGADTVTIRHVEVQGNNDSSGGGSIAQDAVAAAWSNCNTNITFSYFYFHDMGRTHFWFGGSNWVIEYGVTGRYQATAAQHSEIVSTAELITGPIFFRYNLFTYVNPVSTGGLMIDTQGGGSAHIYGNIFWKDPAIATWGATNGAMINGWTGGNGEQFKNVFVYNNTIAAVPDAIQALPLSAPINVHSNDNARNNLFYSANPGGDGGVWDVLSHNHFISATSVGTNVTTGTGNPFVNINTQDFHLTAATPAGFDVGSGPTGCTAGVNCYNVDMFGNVRGADGTWDRGAIEFRAGGADVTPPAAPINLVIQ